MACIEQQHNTGVCEENTRAERKTDGKLASATPNQGLDISFCCCVAKAKAHLKGVSLSQMPVTTINGI